jgi:hypothetical protein
METPPATLSISQAFNPIYAILWEAPLAALRRWDTKRTVKKRHRAAGQSYAD